MNVVARNESDEAIYNKENTIRIIYDSSSQCIRTDDG